MNNNAIIQPTYKAQRPRSDESMQICLDIEYWQKREYIAHGFGIKQQTVAKWFKRVCQDIFKRMRDFIIGLVEDGRPDLALRILRYICGGIGYKPVKKPPRIYQFLSIYQAHCNHQVEMAELSVVFYELIKDGYLTLEELYRIQKESIEERQSHDNFDALLEWYIEECKKRGGRVAVSFEEFTARMENIQSQEPTRPGHA